MYRQGDIVLIPFPYSDLPTTKQRPVLVLSNSTYNKSQSDLVVAAITSNLIKPSLLTEVKHQLMHLFNE
ncbi:type II toxin-antitoxin system PemK/MazF family toxin [Cohnella silvisoli]|uniref:Type II toxin-antitoxin system PemK/MazF family toxin n=2 Tax=Cohnella silvisoli TaxID=2873699 RepID=A0ABV1KQM1_9BACL|nr:type II toxin-antitoxin system PemK/MazF family toxin [Cohnella silvisoli]